MLPPNMHFIERDWLSANHVMFLDEGVASIVDTGYVSHANTTLAHVDVALKAWGGAALGRIINTHIHSDHIGCNTALQSAHKGCTITVPSAEVPALSHWDAPAQMLSYADQQTPRFTWDSTIDAGDTLTLGDETWQSIHTPGHDMGSLVLYCPRLKILISADALWNGNFGFIVPQAIDPKSVEDQRATFDRLTKLDVALVIPGHGPMFNDFQGALARARSKLEAFVLDDIKIAKNVVKGMFIYAMNWRETMPLTELSAYVSKVGVHRDYNAQFFKLSAEAYADWLLSESVKTGKIAVREDQIIYKS